MSSCYEDDKYLLVHATILSLDGSMIFFLTEPLWGVSNT